MLKFEYRFRIISKIDKGAHGQILCAFDWDTDKLVAIKFMNRDARHRSKFEKEVAVFKGLKTLDSYLAGFPEFIMQGKSNYFYFYIMEKLGRCLKKVHSLCKNNKMELKTVLNIGMQIIERLEALHLIGMVRICIWIYLDYSSSFHKSYQSYRCIKTSNQQIFVLAQKIQKTFLKINLMFCIWSITDWQKK